MNKLDRLIVRELIGPWLFGVAIFTALIFASVLLVRITDMVVKGVPLEIVFELSILLLPGIVVKTFSMAMLLAALLAFGRLSNDSEIVAIRAAGASLFRVMRPVLVFSAIVALVSFLVNEWIVPGASYQATSLSTDIKKQFSKTKEARPIHQVLTEKDRAVAYIGAKDFDINAQTLNGVHIVMYGKEGEPTYVMFVDQLAYRGPKDWVIQGGGKILSADGSYVADLQGNVWPSQIVKPDVRPINLLAGIADDLDIFTVGQIRAEIDRMKKDPSPDWRQIHNLEFGFYNKIALPLGVVIFALLGAPLGIRNHRTGVASGFALSIAVSFGYLLLVNSMAVYSKAGQIPPYVASFTPVVIGMVAAAIAIYRKNQ